MKLYLILVLASVVMGGTGGVSIVRLTVPEVVEANASEVVLDCDYQVDEWEQPGLVVKWYVDKIHLVYHTHVVVTPGVPYTCGCHTWCTVHMWSSHLIPPRRPQALGVLSGRVNTTYQASGDPWAAHRAIFIPRPDPTLSGHYSCTVSTFEDEDTRTAHLLVWTPPSSVELKYWRPSEHLVNITCSATGAAPRPDFTLYTRDPNGTRQEVDVREVNGHRQEGLWRAAAWGLIAWEDTEPDTIIGCTLALPGTSHVETRKKLYHPDLPIITTTTTTTTTTQATTPRAGETPRRWSNSTHNVPTTSDSFFDFPGLFGTASAGRSTSPASTHCYNSLMFLPFVLWWLPLLP
ncbi:uncharacterized protein [Panulirus ornatus]|uniref:uncharacterized protein n=1 Tax=Panulirus ornatus TaxID=150431 RepID=UPI003A86D863